MDQESRQARQLDQGWWIPDERKKQERVGHMQAKILLSAMSRSGQLGQDDEFGGIWEIYLRSLSCDKGAWEKKTNM